MLNKLACILLVLAPVYLKPSISEKVVLLDSAKTTYKQILKNHPRINKTYAVELANIIYKVSKEYKINPSRLTAILAQESMYKLRAFNPKSKDYGIAQINHKTAKAFGFDTELLLTDLEYSVRAGATVLSDFKRAYSNKEEDFWTRYNSPTPEKREEYKQLVTRFM